VARNLLGGQKTGSGGRPGAEPWLGLGASPQKPETHAEYSTEQIQNT